MSIYTRHNGVWHRIQPTPAPTFSLPDVTAEGEVLTTTVDSYEWAPLAAYTKEESDAKYATEEYVDSAVITGGGPGILGIHTASANTDQQVTTETQEAFPGMFIRYTPTSGTSILQVSFLFTAFVNSNNGKENAMGELFLKEESTGTTVWSGAVNSKNAQSNATRAVRIRQIIPLQVYLGMTEALKGTELTYQMYGRLPSTEQTAYMQVQNGSYGCQMTVMEIEK